MVDVVVNHFGYSGAGDTVNYTQLHPFDKEEYYHPYCLISDYSKQDNVEDVSTQTKLSMSCGAFTHSC